MRTVYKYPIRITDQQVIDVHCDGGSPARVLMVGLDPHGVACVWVEVDSDLPAAFPLLVYVCGTGNPVPKDGRHLGSFTSGPFVWHVYSPKAVKS